MEAKYFPSASYKLNISTSEGVLSAMASKDSSLHALRLVMDSESVVGISTVSIDNPKALPIHFSTGNGIEALMEWSESSDFVMEE